MKEMTMKQDIIKVLKEAEVLNRDAYEYYIDRYDAEMEAQRRYENDQHLV